MTALEPMDVQITDTVCIRSNNGRIWYHKWPGIGGYVLFSFAAYLVVFATVYDNFRGKAK